MAAGSTKSRLRALASHSGLSTQLANLPVPSYNPGFLRGAISRPGPELPFAVGAGVRRPSSKGKGEKEHYERQPALRMSPQERPEFGKNKGLGDFFVQIVVS